MGWWIFFGLIAVVWFFAQLGKRAAGPPPAPARRHPPRAYSSLERQSSMPSEPASRNRERGRWVAAGDTVKVAGISLEGGMVYVGGVLEAPRGYGTDNCLIDPTLRVAGDNPDVLGETMSYWPSYSAISPRARLAYLQWLAGGRQDPAAAVGYVFLFFYGLERRVFVDEARDDLDEIVGEVRRLLGVYGDNNSFRGYARRFLDMVDLARVGQEAAPELRPDLREGFEIPVPIRVHLGKRLRAGAPLGADDALMWVLALPDTSPRTPVTRCFPEFRALWAERFRGKWPDGLAVKAPETELQVIYRPASGTFQGTLKVDGLPDIGAVTRPLGALRDLLEACTEELDGYSRLLGRRPEARGQLEAALLLPAALHSTEHGGRLGEVRGELEGMIGEGGVVAVRTERLLTLLGMPAVAAPAAALRQAGVSLDLMGIGFEPDRRFGGPGPGDPGQLVLFRQNGSPCDADGTAFAPARTMVEVAALAASADGVIAPAEFDSISADLQAMGELTAAERTRLLAYALALLKDPPRQQAVLNRLTKTPLTERAGIAQSALSAVLADGRVTPEEVKYLERLNKALGLPPEAVYAALHSGTVRVDEPVTVAAEARALGAPIPAAAAVPALALDMARLNRVRQETTAVSALLADIFTEDEALAPAITQPTPAGAAAFPGLDAAHGELLAPFIESGTCIWADFEGRARALRLLPEGALDTINDWAFDRFDEPLLEGGEMVSAAAHLRPRLQQLGAAQ